MVQKLIFYGSLMNIDLFYQITGLKPDVVRYGYVRGNLYEVTDYTEPHGITKYPLLIPEEGTNIVISLEITVDLKSVQLKNFWGRLSKFEGDLFHPKPVTFYPFRGRSARGIIYTGNIKDLQGKRNITKLVPISTVYLWNCIR